MSDVETVNGDINNDKVESLEDTQACKKVSDVIIDENTTSSTTDEKNPAIVEKIAAPQNSEEVAESTTDKNAPAPSSIEEVPDSTSNKKVLAPSSNEVPESTSNEKAVTPTSSDKPPNSQRKPRLNRRSFQLINAALNISPEKKSVEPKLSSSRPSTQPENKSQINTEKRIISLSSIKNSTSQKEIKPSESSKIIILRKCTSTTSDKGKNVTTEADCGPPPKKKHKPITWP